MALCDPRARAPFLGDMASAELTTRDYLIASPELATRKRKNQQYFEGLRFTEIYGHSTEFYGHSTFFYAQIFSAQSRKN